MHVSLILQVTKQAAIRSDCAIPDCLGIAYAYTMSGLSAARRDGLVCIVAANGRRDGLGDDRGPTIRVNYPRATT
jgi:hypothetical protein